MPDLDGLREPVDVGPQPCKGSGTWGIPGDRGVPAMTETTVIEDGAEKVIALRSPEDPDKPRAPTLMGRDLEGEAIPGLGVAERDNGPASEQIGPGLLTVKLAPLGFNHSRGTEESIKLRHRPPPASVSH